MPFAPEDTKVWESSEVMAEFEKVAANTNLLGGGPPEAFQPIPEKVAGVSDPDPSWEEETVSDIMPTAKYAYAIEAFASQQSAMIETVKKIARGLADKCDIKGAYRAERAVAEIETIVRRTPAEGGE